MEIVRELVTDFWNRKDPKLVVSILGGMKNVKPSELEKVKTKLRNGLRDLAMASTNGEIPKYCEPFRLTLPFSDCCSVLFKQHLLMQI